MKLSIHTPPHYDFESTLKNFSTSPDDLSHFQSLKFPTKFFIFSVGRGLVMFVPMEKPEIVYTKISINREVITIIEELKNPKLLLLMSENGSFFACSYESETLEPVLQIEIQESVTCLQAMEPGFLYVAYQTGETHMWEWKENTFFKISENKSQVHFKPVLKVVLVPTYNLLITTSGTESVKFWNMMNLFLKEITFPDKVADVLFCPDIGGLLVAHGKVVSMLETRVFPMYTDVEVDAWMQHPPEVRVDEIWEINVDGSPEAESMSLPELDLNKFKRDKTSLVDGDTEVEDILKMYEEIKSKQAPSTRSSVGKSSRRKRKLHKKLPKLVSTPSPQSTFKDMERLKAEQDHLQSFRKEYLQTISKPLLSVSSRKPEQNPVFLTRRQLTEEKIVSNIIRYGDPADRPDLTGLRVVAEEGVLKSNKGGVTSFDDEEM